MRIRGERGLEIPYTHKIYNNSAKFLNKIIGWSCSRSADGENKSNQEAPSDILYDRPFSEAAAALEWRWRPRLGDKEV